MGSPATSDRLRRVALLQFEPTYADSHSSRAKVERLCASLTRQDGIDLLVAPEMCLTGYVFTDADKVRRLAEAKDDPKAVTLQLAQGLSQRLGCYTLMGFPEVACEQEDTQPDAHEAYDARPLNNRLKDHGQANRQQWFNSAVLTSRSGSILHIFRKHFLYSSTATTQDQDALWASEGPGFQYVDLPDLGRVGVGICMDLNPYRFSEPFEKYELATWSLENKIDVLAMPMAWLSSRGRKRKLANGTITDDRPLDLEKPDLDVIQYWAARCEPLWRKASNDSLGHQMLFITANRTGKESGEPKRSLLWHTRSTTLADSYYNTREHFRRLLDCPKACIGRTTSASPGDAMGSRGRHHLRCDCVTPRRRFELFCRTGRSRVVGSDRPLRLLERPSVRPSKSRRYSCAKSQ